MLEILKELTKLYKEKKQEEKYRTQLLKMPLNFELLEHLATKYKDRKITVAISGGDTIIIEPQEQKQQYKSFKQRFEEAHS